MRLFSSTEIEFFSHPQNVFIVSDATRLLMFSFLTVVIPTDLRRWRSAITSSVRIGLGIQSVIEMSCSSLRDSKAATYSETAYQCCGDTGYRLAISSLSMSPRLSTTPHHHVSVEPGPRSLQKARGALGTSRLS